MKYAYLGLGVFLLVVPRRAPVPVGALLRGVTQTPRAPRESHPPPMLVDAAPTRPGTNGPAPLTKRLPDPEQRRERFAKEGERVDAQVPARPDDAVQRRRRPATLRAAAELPVGASHDNLAECPLREVIVYREISLLREPHQCRPVRQRVAHRLAQRRLRQGSLSLPDEPGVELLAHRGRLRGPVLLPADVVVRCEPIALGGGLSEPGA